jgi:hypothetical protein
MFHSAQLLTKNGPLAIIWTAAHLDRQLKRSQISEASISTSVDVIMQGPSGEEEAPIALRLSGQLLLGLVRIYARQVGGRGAAAHEPRCPCMHQQCDAAPRPGLCCRQLPAGTWSTGRASKRGWGGGQRQSPLALHGRPGRPALVRRRPLCLARPQVGYLAQDVTDILDRINSILVTQVTQHQQQQEPGADNTPAGPAARAGRGRKATHPAVAGSLADLGEEEAFMQVGVRRLPTARSCSARRRCWWSGGAASPRGLASPAALACPSGC